MADFEFEPADKEPTFSGRVAPTRKQSLNPQQPNAQESSSFDRGSLSQHQESLEAPNFYVRVYETLCQLSGGQKIASVVFIVIVVLFLLSGEEYEEHEVDRVNYENINGSNKESINSRKEDEVDNISQGSVDNTPDASEIFISSLSRVNSGVCNIGRFRSKGGQVKIGQKSINTNWRRIEFIYCVERGDENYLIAEAYGNNAVGYLVFDNQPSLELSSYYGCVLHSKYKIIKNTPSDFLPITCSEVSLSSLK